jgi:hypothetical protein
MDVRPDVHDEVEDDLTVVETSGASEPTEVGTRSASRRVIDPPIRWMPLRRFRLHLGRARWAETHYESLFPRANDMPAPYGCIRHIHHAFHRISPFLTGMSGSLSALVSTGHRRTPAIRCRGGSMGLAGADTSFLDPLVECGVRGVRLGLRVGVSGARDGHGV